MLNIENTQ